MKKEKTSPVCQREFYSNYQTYEGISVYKKLQTLFRKTVLCNYTIYIYIIYKNKPDF